MAVADISGFETLQAIGKATRFNQWMFSAIAPYCSGKILETGSGTGNISRHLLNAGFELTLSEIDKDYLRILEDRFGNSPNLKGILSIDLQHPAFNDAYSGLKEGFDCLVMLNVLEHLPNESDALQHCSYLLKPGGTLIILVPAYGWLYSGIDQELGHRKRYTSRELKAALSNQHFLVTRTFYFNALGIPAWLYGKIFRLKTVPAKEMSLFDRLTGPGKWIDKILAHKTGLSVIGVARKP